MDINQNKQACTVTEAVHRAKAALESCTLTLVGEVSELSNKSGYKAVYFTVKDDQSTLSCMMWKNRYIAAGVDLYIGALVQLTGRFTLYAARGTMNFEVYGISLAGEGELRAKVAALAEKLRQEGLMDDSRKRPKPQYPQTIGLVTSPRGATVHDVLRTLRRRFPLIKVLLAGVPVEGKEAPAAMIEGMRCVAAAGAECILLIRGGGSYESLMPFNDELLARAIAASPVPVLTGIGHEPDNSIADMVADVRCSTPTAAAEAISPLQGNLFKGFDNAAKRLNVAVERTLRENASKLDIIGSRPVFTDQSYLLSQNWISLDRLNDGLYNAIPKNIKRDESDIASLEARLRSAGSTLLMRDESALDNASASMKRSASTMLDKHEADIQAATSSIKRSASTFADRFEKEIALNAARLNDLSPLTILSRGYSISRNQDGEVMRSVSQVQPGQNMKVTLADGVVDATVVSASPNK